ncbi:LuxR family transcriptional regulator (plasmid) [Frondihabitans sp. PAMC 28766]|uniref:response regulator n=1 Tax=Frondihabitans sp. PAMC 28766 TaxID=1795630 RepID=UPI00078B1D86|nr:response regulator transcription factor [Frondihabitans sp. PAMC 28766]AMM22702.1 LuxR family transcriptional regulator [Frondihabitans sp. PAMC 28766]
MTRIFLVDDHEVVRRGVADLIDAEDDFDVVGEAGTIAQALARIAATMPDVAVLDVGLPDGSGIDLCREIRSSYPSVVCLMFTAYDDDEASLSAVLAGAAGYVIKDIRGQKLVDSIRLVATGKTLVNPDVSRDIVAKATAPSTERMIVLTLREREVLELIAEGLSNRQIGEILNLAEKTVKNYVSAILRTLGMERRTQAAVYGAGLRKN